MRIFQNLHYDFLGHRKIAYIVSGTLILLGIISLLVRGLELGIDFKGGTEIAVQFQNPVSITEVRSASNEMGLGKVEVKTFGGETGILIRTEMQQVPKADFNSYILDIKNNITKLHKNAVLNVIDTTSSSITFEFGNHEIAAKLNDELFKAGFQTSLVSQEAENKAVIIRVGISDIIQQHLRAKFPNNGFNILKEDQVGPKIGKELKVDAVIAVVLSLLGILIYLGFRFKFIFAVGAVTALFHDVMITLGLFSMFYGMFSWLNLEISINVVAAFLTLVGYSINDTVVVFDRVRENIKIHKTAKLKDNINDAINSTMPRTIITSFTTLLSTFVLLIFGGDVLRGFAFTLFIGVIVGTYSSIFVASTLVQEYALKKNKKVQF